MDMRLRVPRGQRLPILFGGLVGGVSVALLARAPGIIGQATVSGLLLAPFLLAGLTGAAKTMTA